MNVKPSRLVLGAFAAVFAAFSPGNAFAAPTPVKVDMTYLRCIQNYAVAAKDDDPVYLTVSGIAKGAEVTKRIPESGTMEAGTKKPAVDDKKPVTLWEGELNDGEFAVVTVALYQGKGEDAAAKGFDKQIVDAAKGVAERSKKTLKADEVKALATALVKAEQGVVTKVHDTLSRAKNTDHFNGLFNIVVLNDGGKIVKRLDPVGLTFGEHFGTNEKIYSKIKYTRKNVLVADGEEWFPQELPPISEDKQTVRVKMLETEYFEEDGKKKRNVTDYLADLQVSAGGKPLEWKLGGENVGPTQTHMWWDFAE
jgi:hypothetical protein